jgi:hypothetical protein
VVSKPQSAEVDQLEKDISKLSTAWTLLFDCQSSLLDPWRI